VGFYNHSASDPFFAQLFWVEKIRKTPMIRLFIAVSILFAALLVNGDLVEMITNIEKEYAEISNKLYYLNLVKNTILFTILVTVVTLIRSKINPNKI
jgi:ABC-type spermidine/putrescine transport system permease subunit I